MTHTYPRLVTSRHTHTSPVPHGTCIASHTLASCHSRRGWCRSICLVLTRQNVSAVLPRCLPLLLLLCSVGVGVRAIDVRVVQCAACLQNPLCVCVCERERERERERASERERERERERGRDLETSLYSFAHTHSHTHTSTPSAKVELELEHRESSSDSVFFLRSSVSSTLFFSPLTHAHLNSPCAHLLCFFLGGYLLENSSPPTRPNFLIFLFLRVCSLPVSAPCVEYSLLILLL
jgi:hypothetical protein